MSYRFGPYWNKTEVLWWAAIGVVLVAYAVAVLGFGVDTNPTTWIGQL